MSNRRIIYDSEDEDAGFSPINSPVKGGLDAADGAIALQGDALGQQLGESAIDQRSTDPDFFQKVYDEQQHVPDSAANSRAEGVSSNRQKSSDPKAKNSSSLTDPTEKSAKRKSKLAVNAKDFADLTQVTTPRNDGSSGSHKDVYEFPGSDGEGDNAKPKAKATTAKTYSKRKRVGSATPASTVPSSSPARPSARSQGLSLTRMQEDEVQSPKSARKKTSNGTQRTSDGLDEDVDLLVVPRTAETNQSPAEPCDGHDGQDSVVPDTLNEAPKSTKETATSFFIAPPNHLTTSQKQEYVRVSGSSEHDNQAGHEDALPIQHLDTQTQKLRSSEATIAYTTPSRYCSSAPAFPERPENDGRNSSGLTSSSRRAQNSMVRTTEPHSSPDELNSHVVEQLGPRTKRKRNADQTDELAVEESWDSDKIGYAQEKYNPRPSRRRPGIDEDEQRTQADVDAGITKKRQKTDRYHDAAQDDSWDSDKIGAHRESYKPRPSRRRSRAILDAGDEDLAAPERSMPDTCPPGPGSPDGIRHAEPILISSGQQAPQEQDDTIEGIDPSYLAALPEDLRQEVIAGQLARNSQTSRTRGRGRPSQSGGIHVPPSEETLQPKKRGRKKKETVNEDALTMPEEADSQAAAAPTIATKKKRGRPKKSDVTQPPPAKPADDDITLAHGTEDMSNIADDADVAEAQSPQVVQDAPAPSKAPSKRGRKKKVVAGTPAAPDEESSIHGAEEATYIEHEEATEIRKAPSKRGRKRKVIEEPPADDESAEPVHSSQQEPEAASVAEDCPKAAAGVNRKALADISNTTSSQGPAEEIEGKEGAAPEDTAGMLREGTPEAKVKDTPRSASSTTNQQGKVPLRVGLSKRSRIAPLLKIIRK
ncbi:hypothetical protein N8I77_006546 [Diaporthe amygdali]|uniref:Uncharacterized protein n=1 Tax=Phomopsis amygdali TaxID=1214568 RepID=A0AAD9SIF3_PHOAM|nr:hypothetical protein N8I77_006546 [Diaporthe amygdali]